MVFNIGLRLTVPSTARFAATSMPAKTRWSSFQSAQVLSRTFSSASSRNLISPAPRITSASNLASQSLLRSRFFSTSPVSRNTPAPTQPSSPTPSPPQPKQPLSEDILTIPNLLTISRLLLTPYIGYLVATHHFVPAVSLLFIASLTDLLDGWLARRTGKYTVFGSIADPAADKALVTTMVISLAMSGMLPWTIATIILGRDVALVISAFIIRYRTLEEPKTLSRYFNPKLPSATVTPTQISKYNTFLQLLLLGVLTLYPILFPGQGSPGLTFSSETKKVDGSKGEVKAVQEAREKLAQKGLLSERAKEWIDKSITSLMWITAATTVWSGLGYLGGAGTGKVLARAQNAASKARQTLQKSSSPKAPS